MGTRSAIGYKKSTGVRAKYSHYDGYPAYTGAMLQEHYQQSRKIAQMVELGDQSFLEKEIFPSANSNHSFDSPEDGVTIFYGRDRGESDVDAKDFETVAEFIEHYASAGCEYFYLWDGQQWIVNDHEQKDEHGFYVFDFVSTRVPA